MALPGKGLFVEGKASPLIFLVCVSQIFLWGRWSSGSMPCSLMPVLGVECSLPSLGPSLPAVLALHRPGTFCICTFVHTSAPRVLLTTYLNPASFRLGPGPLHPESLLPTLKCVLTSPPTPYLPDTEHSQVFCGGCRN